MRGPTTFTSLIQVFVVFFVFPAVCYALLISNGTLNFFADEYGWRLYNHYALSLMDGRFDVSLDVTGAESFIVNGKVYVYYGLLPAFARIPLSLVFDLETVPLGRLITWTSCTLAAGFVQLAVLRLYYRCAAPSRLLLVVASLAIWFGSGPWIIVHIGTFYNEPFAMGLMLSGLVTYLLVDDLLIKEKPPGLSRLALYALAAGLTVFARPTMAVSLYAVVGLLALWAMLTRGSNLATIGAGFARAMPAGLIMLAAGLGYLWTNQVRFGAAGEVHPIDSYGYYIMLRTIPGKDAQIQAFLTIRDIGAFHWSRIVPTFGYMLTGLPFIGGAALRQEWIQAWGGGSVMTYLSPYRLVLGWAPALLVAALGVRAIVTLQRKWLCLAFLAAFAIGGFLQLAYANFWVRYAAELWPAVAFLMCLAFLRPLPVRFARAWTIALPVSAIMMLAYNLTTVSQLKFEPRGPGSLAEPVPEVLREFQKSSVR